MIILAVNQLILFAGDPVLDKAGNVLGLEYPVVNPDDEKIHKIIYSVWDAYKNIDGWGLSEITHKKGGAWDKAYDGGRGVSSPN